MLQHFSTWIAMAAVLMSTSGCGDSNLPVADASKASAPQDSHERMIESLRKIHAQMPDSHKFLGDADLRQFEDLLAHPEELSEASRFDLLWQCGNSKLRLGRTEDAIADLLSAQTMLSKIGRYVPSENQENFILDLGIAYLRLGENQNCVKCSNGESCILPIRGRGVHRQREGALKAIEQFKILLKRFPNNLTARWLLNLGYMVAGGYPQDVPPTFLISPEKFASAEDFPRFPNIAGDLGLNVVNLCGGSIVEDFDSDGFLDILISSWHTAGAMHYFRNHGNGTFSDESESAGLTGINSGLNMMPADYDNDGDVDVLVLRGAWLEKAGRYPNSLLRNDGKGHFRDVTFDVGLGDVHYPTQTASWADYDNDGDLDLYIGNENFPCQLFQNDGHGKFRDLAKAAGVENGRYTKAVVWGDYDNDCLPDIYVSNFHGENRLYHNKGNGTFEDVAPQLHVTRPIISFPAWFWDFNNDGNLDIFVGSYVVDVKMLAAEYCGKRTRDEPDCLYQGDGKGGFVNVTAKQKLNRVTQPMGSNFGDLDNDGYPDFYLGTGYPNYDALMPNLMFHNLRGNGFADVSSAGGFSHLQKGHGVSFADLDNDGDQDVHIQLGGAYAGDVAANALFENPGFGNHWLAIKLVGRKSNRSGIGSRISAEIMEDGAKRTVYKWVNSGGSFGANPLRRQQLGVGKALKISTLEVFWPATRTTQRFHDVPVDQSIEITEGATEYRPLEWKTFRFKTSATTTAAEQVLAPDITPPPPSRPSSSN